MAGMLPGVECARRRRFHQGGSADLQSSVSKTRTRRSSFCLYTSSHETSRSTQVSSFSQRFQTFCSKRTGLSQRLELGKLAGNAREAKERLDEKLRTQRNITRPNSMGNIRQRETVGVSARELRRTVTESKCWEDNYEKGLDSAMLGCLRREIFNGKKKNSKGMFSWAKLSWKAVEQDECSVCLEWFKMGEALVLPPCAHRFHSSCLLPWLKTHSICPCCRMQIPSTCRI